MPSPDEPKHIYLAGPMQNVPNFNFPRFNAVAACLRKSGHTVFNPAEKDIERHNGVDIAADNASGSLAEAKAKHKFSLRQALGEDLAWICGVADVVALLPGWEKSNGAQAEHRTAVALQSEGMELVYLTEEMCTAMQMMAEVASA